MLPTSSETHYSLPWQWTCVVLIDRTRVGKSFDAISEILEFFLHREQVSNSNGHSRLYPCSVCGKWRHNPACIAMLTLTGTARIYAHTHVSKEENYLRKLWDKTWLKKKNIFIHSSHGENLWNIVMKHMHYDSMDFINGDDFVRFHHHKHAHKFQLIRTSEIQWKKIFAHDNEWGTELTAHSYLASHGKFSSVFYLFAEHFLCFWQLMGKKNGTTDSFASAESEATTHTEKISDEKRVSHSHYSFPLESHHRCADFATESLLCSSLGSFPYDLKRKWGFCTTTAAL